MQPYGGPSRSMQRRSPGAEPGPPPSVPVRSISPAMGLGGGPGGGAATLRSSTMSSRSAPSQQPGGANATATRRANTSAGSATTASSSSSSSSSVPLSQIEKSVTHLLVATKQLLETLTQWSRGQATDTQVSDVYVKLGYEFNMACRAFTAINVETRDLGNVPEDLRNILEATLSQEASVESLERYLPKIRDIIINLLHGLKRKQQKLRARQSRERDGGVVAAGSADSATATATATATGRTTSTSTTGSGHSGLTSLLNEGLEDNNAHPPGGSGPGYRPDVLPREDRMGGGGGGGGNVHASPTRNRMQQQQQGRDRSRGGSVNSEQSSLSSTTMQSMPVVPPYPGDETTIPMGSSVADLDSFPPPPPPPPPKQQSALAALQRGGDLERRASRRYSAYQISKHLGTAGPGVPMLPPQTTPIPNRGRGEVRESLRAMNARETTTTTTTATATMGRHHRNMSSQSKASVFESSPVRVPSRVSEEPDGSSAGSAAAASVAASAREEVPSTQSPEDGYPKPSATLQGPPSDPVPLFDADSPVEEKASRAAPQAVGSSSSTSGRSGAVADARSPPRAETPAMLLPPSGSFTTEGSPPSSTKELTLFLQYKSKVKKFVLPEGYSELSIGRLQLAFIEKFSWNTQQNGVDLPDIYIQDPVSGVRHELEDLSDIKDRTVLALNVEPLDEVKKHIDEGLGSLRAVVEQVRQNVDDQSAALQRVSERQQETAKDLARLAAAPPPSIMTPPADSPHKANGFQQQQQQQRTRAIVATPSQIHELQSLRRDLAVLRQTYSRFQAEVQGSMHGLRAKANKVKVAAARMAVPDVEGDTGHAYVKQGRKQLNADSDRLVNKVDDLQDLVEDLRKDVVHRGVRPLPRQLEAVAKDIAVLTKELKKMDEYIRREKPVWTKIWEKELEEVCQGRDELRLMEDLMVDLQDDLEKASETFALVEQATKEQMKDAGAADGSGSAAGAAGAAGPAGRPFGGVLRPPPVVVNNAGVDPSAAKEGVLGEVRALRPNHENRLEAIERAEKLRQKELASRRENPLKKELAHFVEEGKLRKSGGVEEVERARRAKDERIRREVWERQNGLLPAEPPAGEEPAGGASSGAGGGDGGHDGETGGGGGSGGGGGGDEEGGTSVENPPSGGAAAEGGAPVSP